MVQSVRAPASYTTPPGVLQEVLYQSPRDPDATTASLVAALSLDLSSKAYRLYAAVLLTCPQDVWLSVLDMAAAAGIGDHQARPLVGELCAAGLLGRRRKVVDGAQRIRYYAKAAVAA